METTSDLLTVKEVQALLKVDRITVYRMLKDGRLSGFKIGQQWRFARDRIGYFVSGERSLQGDAPPVSLQVLPLHCLQSIQDVLAEVAEVAAITTAPDGESLTRISNPSKFCKLILASESGHRACVASWRKLAEDGDSQPRFTPCHAGLQYASARVHVDGQLAALLVAGQFYVLDPDRREESTRVIRLARRHGIKKEELTEAAQALATLDARKQDRIGHWLENVAHTFEQVGCERAELMYRLRQIADMSNLSSLTGDQRIGLTL